MKTTDPNSEQFIALLQKKDLKKHVTHIETKKGQGLTTLFTAFALFTYEYV